jgi:hypothetical protein
MRKLRTFCSVTTLVFAIALVASPVYGFEVASLSMEELSDGSIVEYESSFCEVLVGDTVTVTLMETDATVVSAEVKTRNGATPNRGKNRGGPRTATVVAVLMDSGTSVDLTLDSADDGWHTVHVKLELSTGDKLGVNLHSTMCDEEELDALMP